MKYVLAIDEGTTGATCMMIGEDGRVAGRGYREIPQYFPEPGWVEHDANEIWSTQLGVATEAILKAELEAMKSRFQPLKPRTVHHAVIERIRSERSAVKSVY